MNKISLTLAAGLMAASLGGCMVTAGGSGVPIPAPFPSTGNTTIDAVIAEAQSLCGFAPAVGTVSSIIDTFVPGTALVGTIANGICNALTKKSARRGGAGPTYRGVAIAGRRV
jgi:hypothetical protein